MPKALHIVTCAAILLMAACAPSIAPTPMPTPIPSPTAEPTPTATPAFVPRTLTNDAVQQVGLRFVHAAAGVGGVDIYAELLAVATRLMPGQVAGDTLLASGSYTLRVVPSGQSIDGETLATATITIEGDRRYTFVLGGEANAMTITALPDANDPIPSNNSRVQLVNAAAGAPPLAMAIGGNAASVSDLGFASESAPVLLNAERTSLRVTAGSTSLDVSVELRPGRHYTLIVTLDPDTSAGLRATIMDVEIPGQAVVRIVQGLAADVGPVDVYVDSEPIASSLVFGSASDTVALAARVATLTVLPTGAPRDTFPILATTIAPNSNDELTVLLTGNNTTSSILTYTADLSPLEPDQTRVTFVNLYADATALAARTETTLYEGSLTLPYGGPPLTSILAPGAPDITWVAIVDEDTQPTTLFTDSTEFQAGMNYLYVVTGRQDAPALLFSNSVGERADTPVNESTVRLRAVNTMADTPADFQMNDRLFAEDIAPLTGSGLIAVEAGDVNVFVHTATASSFIEVTLSAYGRYSLYVFGSANDPLLMMIEEDDVTFSEDTGRIRLVQIGRPDQSPTLALGFAASGASAINTDAAVTPFPESSGSPIVNIPFGVRELVRGVEGGQASLMGQLPVGLYDFYIIDSDSSSVIGLLPAFDLENRKAFEIVTTRSFVDGSLTSFVLPYPLASG